jgi:predicted enzyme related to lactoylglutathione lyase
MSDVRTDVAPTASQQAQRNPHGTHIWYELMTPDPEGSKAFYDAVVPGWSIGERLPGDIDYRMIGRGDGGNAGGVLRLTDEMQQHGAKPIWLGYVCVDDVDRTVGQIEAKGGKVLMPASDIPDVGRIAMVADPQGAPFYVMKPIPPAGQQNAQSDVFSPDKQGRVSWNELSTSDPEAARRFYGELFGWTSDDFMPMGDMGEYRFLAHHGTPIGAVFNSSAGAPTTAEQPPHWRHYIRVPSVSAAAEAVKAGGGTVTMGPHEVPGGDHIVIGIDPQGAEFALVGKY